MKTIKNILSIAIGIILLTACEKPKDTAAEAVPVRINMDMDTYTGMQYITDKHIWKTEDKVKVHSGEQNNVREIGQPLTPGTQSSTFIYSLTLPQDKNTLLGIYPADAEIEVKEGILSYNIPTVQDGTVTDLQAGKTTFKKGGQGLISMSLTPLYKVLNICIGRGNRTIESITIKSNDGSLIAGTVRRKIDDWSCMAMDGSVTVIPKEKVSCYNGSVSIPVMVADISSQGYTATVKTVEGETFKAEKVIEGHGSAEKEYELGVSQALFGSLSQSEALSLTKAGVKYLEVTMNTFWRDQTEEECTKRFENTKKIINNTDGLEVWSVHLPFSKSLDISVTNATKRTENVELQKKMIRMAGEFKPKRLILHPSSEPISDGDREARLKNAIESIGILKEVAKEVGAVLCIENLPRTCLCRTSDEMLRILEAHPEVMVCFDSNHLLIETHQSFFKNVGNRIGTTHASDYDAIDERHWVPGKGVIDWPAFLTSLMHYGYDGVFMTEVSKSTLDEVVDSYKNVICKTK